MVLPSDIVRAGVIADGVDTRYLSAGRGAPVLVLSEDSERRAALVTRLPRDLRAIAPEIAARDGAAGRDFPSWLACFLDALGILRVAVVADASLAARAVGVALADPSRVASLVLLQSGSCNEGDGEAEVREAGEIAAGTPLLATWVGADPASLARAIPRIVEFIAMARGED